MRDRKSPMKKMFINGNLEIGNTDMIPIKNQIFFLYIYIYEQALLNNTNNVCQTKLDFFLFFELCKVYQLCHKLDKLTKIV